MSFTYQVNPKIEFIKDQNLLKKAEQAAPDMRFQSVKDYTLVQTVNDPDMLEGIGVKKRKEQLEDLALDARQSVILDFGRHCTGYFSISLDKVGSPMDSPLRLRLCFAEMPCELEQKSEEYDGWLSASWMQEEIINLDVLPCRLELPRRYAFRYVKIEVLAKSVKWKVRLSKPEVITVTSAPAKACFVPEVSDPELAEICRVSLDTLSECMQKVYEDGPKRDRRLWLGDLRLQAKANYASFRDQTLVKRCLYLFGAMPAADGRISANLFIQPEPVPDDTFLMDYSLFFISVLHDYIQEFEDLQALQDLYPAARNTLDYALKYLDDTGCFQVPEEYPVFVDWSADFDKSTCAQAILIYVLRQFLFLQKKLGLTKADRFAYQDALERSVRYAREELYDPHRNLFVSQGEYNLASQVWMVIAGVFDKEQNRRIMLQALEEFFPVSGIATPYMYHHITEALFLAGLQEEAVSLIKSYWGKMLEMGADTFWEAFDPDQPACSPYGSSMVNSYCHAWSCTPVYLIKEYLIREPEHKLPRPSGMNSVHTYPLQLSKQESEARQASSSAS